jgi:hypothetical protein
MVSVCPQVEPGGHLPGDGGEGAHPRHGDLAPPADALRHLRHRHSPDRPRHVLGKVFYPYITLLYQFTTRIRIQH